MAEPSRIKEIPETDMTAEQQKVFADLLAGRGKLLAPYKIWIHSPRLAAALETIGTFLNKKGSLCEREVELIICIIANHWKSEYVWSAHVNICLKLGYPQTVFADMRAGKTPARSGANFVTCHLLQMRLALWPKPVQSGKPCAGRPHRDRPCRMKIKNTFLSMS